MAYHASQAESSGWLLHLDKALNEVNGTKTGQMIYRMTVVMRGENFGFNRT
jgi:hypothetical protein